MPRRRKPVTATYTGIVVVAVAAFVTSALTLGSLWAYLINHDKETGRELLVQAVAALGVTTALAARTRPDPASTPLVTDSAGQQSVAVTAVNPPTDPVNTAAADQVDPATDVGIEILEPAADLEEPVDPDPPRRRR